MRATNYVIWLAGICFALLPCLITFVLSSIGSIPFEQATSSIYKDLLIAAIVIGGVSIAESFVLFMSMDRDVAARIRGMASVTLILLLLTLIVCCTQYGGVQTSRVHQNITISAWLLVGIYNIVAIGSALLLKTCQEIRREISRHEAVASNT